MSLIRKLVKPEPLKEGSTVTEIKNNKETSDLYRKANSYAKSMITSSIIDKVYLKIINQECASEAWVLGIFVSVYLQKLYLNRPSFLVLVLCVWKHYIIFISGNRELFLLNKNKCCSRQKPKIKIWQILIKPIVLYSIDQCVKKTTSLSLR